MYKIEKKKFGFYLTFGGFVKREEMLQWKDESVTQLADMSPGFGVFVDMRTLKPLPAESQGPMEEGQKLYKQKGMTRSVVILDNAITTLQFKKIAKHSGIYEWERYIDASSVADWEAVGIAWIENEIDPDQDEA